MSHGFSPELSRLVEQKMASGLYASEDDLLVEAIHALDDVRQRHEELRGEIGDRLKRSGQGMSQPLDRDSFKAEARRRMAA